MDLYREDVMDHYENPRNLGSFDQSSHGEILTARESNASCGDMIQMQIKIVGDKQDRRIEEVRWEGVGCAITMASASKLSVYLQGRTLKQLREMGEGQIIKEGIGIEVNPGRLKCLTLPVKVVSKLLEN
jgi:nitrogen fixation protein NifU and related proteins